MISLQQWKLDTEKLKSTAEQTTPAEARDYAKVKNAATILSCAENVKKLL